VCLMIITSQFARANPPQFSCTARQVGRILDHLCQSGPTDSISGVGKSSVLDRLERANWNNVTRLDRSQTKNVEIIKKRFSDATLSQPSLILMDDLETLAGRKSESDLLARTLTSQIQKLSGSRVQVVASTSRPIDIDPKLLGVFRKVIELSIPTTSSRGKILIELVASIASNEDVEYVASRTHAFTAADLDVLCDEAYEFAFERSHNMINGELNGESEVCIQADSSGRYIY
jgi:SpoVK/Ycf46/Vps4 family AAA+-type ATPase